MIIKETLRAEYRARTVTLTPEYRHDSDHDITAKLSASELYKKSGTIFCFIGVRNEIDTMPFIQQAILSGDKRVCAPLTLGSGIMEARLITKTQDIGDDVRAFGLREPKQSCPLVPPEEIDLVIVPCLSADPYGNRLGYGSGYYDRYLKQLRDKTITIADCRDELLAMTLPSGSNDVKVKYYATESGVRKALTNRV